jgi:hypothetical protein
MGLGGHLVKDLNRLKYLGHLPDLLNPQEIWVDYIELFNKKTKLPHPSGRKTLRYTLLTTVENKKGKPIGLVMSYQNNGKGQLEAHTFFVTKSNKRYRKGTLVARQ